MGDSVSQQMRLRHIPLHILQAELGAFLVQLQPSDFVLEVPQRGEDCWRQTLHDVQEKRMEHIRGSMELFYILLKTKEQRLRRDARRGWRRVTWIDDRCRRGRDILVVWHHVAHAVAMGQRSTTIPKR